MSKFVPNSNSVLKDLSRNIDLEKEHPFFESVRDAELFFAAGVEPYLHLMQKKISFADFGGGQGLLASAICNLLEDRDHLVSPIVVDANQVFLNSAKMKGLRTVLENIEDVRLPLQDIILMRLVNHYNSRNKQMEILKNVYDNLRPEGMFVMQLETGGIHSCKLRNEVSELLGNYCPNTSNYWVSKDEVLCMLEKIGLAPLPSAREEPVFYIDVATLLRNAWDRSLGGGQDSEQQSQFNRQAADIIIDHISSDNGEDSGVFEKDGLFYVRSIYPIITTVRMSK
jgi:hypothetical protein